MDIGSAAVQRECARRPEIDFGFGPDDPERGLVFSWRREIECRFPFFNVRAALQRFRT